MIIGLSAALLLASAVSTASARDISVSNQNIRETWSSLEVEASEGTFIRCQLTLEGSFHARTHAKVERSLVGYITKVQGKQETCTGGTLSFFNGIERYNGVTPSSSLPWHMTYKSFSGSLPSISIFRRAWDRIRAGVKDLFGLCTGQYGTAADRIVFNDNREAGGGITSVEPNAGENTLSLFRRDAGILCPATGRMTGRGSLMVVGSTTRITITLI